MTQCEHCLQRDCASNAARWRSPADSALTPGPAFTVFDSQVFPGAVLSLVRWRAHLGVSGYVCQNSIFLGNHASLYWKTPT